MQPAKTTVMALLEKLPDDCSLEDVLYHLYVIQKIEAGLAEEDLLGVGRIHLTDGFLGLVQKISGCGHFVTSIAAPSG